MRGKTATSVLAAIALGCGGSRANVAGGQVLAAEARAVRDLVALALDLDVTASRAADTLYDDGALVIANGRERIGAPRFAAVGPDGVVTIASARVEVVPGGPAWVFVAYRWTGGATTPEVGTATILLKQRVGGWKITHAHSSQQLPWQ